MRADHDRVARHRAAQLLGLHLQHHDDRDGAIRLRRGDRRFDATLGRALLAQPDLRDGVVHDLREMDDRVAFRRAMKKAGIPILCYNFMAGTDWVRTSTTEKERGGALVRFAETAVEHVEGAISERDLDCDYIAAGNVLAGVHRALRPGGWFLMFDVRAASALEDNIGNPLAPFKRSRCDQTTADSTRQRGVPSTSLTSR